MTVLEHLLHQTYYRIHWNFMKINYLREGTVNKGEQSHMVFVHWDEKTLMKYWLT